MTDEGTALAPAGKVWVCLACGKKSRTKYGFDKDNKDVADRGWDESCMLNSQLFEESRLVLDEDGRVQEVKDDHTQASE